MGHRIDFLNQKICVYAVELRKHSDLKSQFQIGVVGLSREDG